MAQRHAPHRDDGGVTTRPSGPDEVPRIVEFLDAAEEETGSPLVDEAERLRLGAALADPQAAPPDWSRFVAERGGVLVGYAAATDGVGDLAVVQGSDRDAAVTALATTLAADDSQRPLQLWMRCVTEDDAALVSANGFAIQRRLGVLRRSLLEPSPPPRAPDGITIRGYVPDRDDSEVVEVLAAAYEGTDDGGWDLREFRRRRGRPWFRAEDLLLAVGEDGRVAGLHWLKRRDAVSGEVYNLALHPRAQGGGLGQALLAAGLVHLADKGCAEVVLWVDLANQRAVRLYHEMGFTTRWEDVAFTTAEG